MLHNASKTRKDVSLPQTILFVNGSASKWLISSKLDTENFCHLYGRKNFCLKGCRMVVLRGLWSQFHLALTHFTQALCSDNTRSNKARLINTHQ